MTTHDRPNRYFPYDYDARFAPIWAAFRVWPGAQGVIITDDGRFLAGYGPLRIHTPLSQI